MGNNLLCNSLWAIIYLFRSCLFFKLCFLKISSILCLSSASWETICWYLLKRTGFLVTYLVQQVCDLWYEAEGSLVVYHHTGSPSFMPFPTLFIFSCRSDFLSGIIYLLPKDFALTFLVVQVCWQLILLVFVCLKKSFSFIFERYLCRCSILGWQFFSFSTVEILLHCLLAFCTIKM